MCCPLATGRPINVCFVGLVLGFFWCFVCLFSAGYKIVLAMLVNAVSARVKIVQKVKPKNLQCLEVWPMYLQA